MNSLMTKTVFNRNSTHTKTLCSITHYRFGFNKSTHIMVSSTSKTSEQQKKNRYVNLMTVTKWGGTTPLSTTALRFYPKYQEKWLDMSKYTLSLHFLFFCQTPHTYKHEKVPWYKKIFPDHHSYNLQSRLRFTTVGSLIKMPPSQTTQHSHCP